MPDASPPQEGGLGAPLRHPLDWQSETFTDAAALDAELRRQFDVCHGCRRCFNLCESFPRLFDLIDGAPSGELDSVQSDGFGAVVDGCTLCDMCFMTKCPYVPPHEFNIDFPHLMLRYRATKLKERKGRQEFPQSQLSKTDRNGKLAALAPAVTNWGSARSNWLTRPAMDKVVKIDKRAELPKFYGSTYMRRARKAEAASGWGTDAAAKQDTAKDKAPQALIFPTCFVNYNAPATGEAAARVLAHWGVDVKSDYTGCCGMPTLEQGDLADVAARARRLASDLAPHIAAGRTIVTLTASCSLMLKLEYPLLLPDDDAIKTLAGATQDICEYVLGLARTHGVPEGLRAPAGKVAVHMACHARAQNMGPLAADMLRLIPGVDLQVTERCSGHGGTFGVVRPTHELARKHARPTVRQLQRSEPNVLVSDCPLAAKHLLQTWQDKKDDATAPLAVMHPIELFARACGLTKD